MNDIRRTILLVVFMASLAVLFDHWQVYNGRKSFFLPSPPDATVSAAQAPSGPVPGGAGSPAAVPSPAQSAAAAPAAASEKVTVATDVFRAVIDTQGGTLSRLELLKYTEDTPQSGLVDFVKRLFGQPIEKSENRQITLMEDGSAATAYAAQTGLLDPANRAAHFFPDHFSVMSVQPGPRALANGQDTLDVTLESPVVNGLKYIKTYHFRRGDYIIGVSHQVVNVGSQPADAQLYLQIQRHGVVPQNHMLGTSTFTGPAVYTDDKKFHKVAFTDISKNKADLPSSSDNGWIAMVQHYFVSAWLLDVPGHTGLKRDFRAADLGNNQYSIAMVLHLPPIAAGATETVQSKLYAGPEEEKKLEALAPGLELVKDYGIFAIISKPLYWLMYWLHGVLGNWGWSIVAVVVLLKLVFFWLNAKAYSSMARMKAVNPRVMEVRERLKDKPQEMQKEMMRIYREEKINPIGGCLPIAIQIPVFIALYWVLLSSVEMRQAPWIGWIHDLSSPDPWFILPALMTISSLFQTWLNPAPPDPMQAKLMWIMPLVFSVMFLFFPAGLVLYWVTNNILSIAQQWLINSRLGLHAAKPPKQPSKPGKA
ncbi:MAG: membrane protein insertase YidC [Burkholderiaceae bacterium]|jgi:YidC/Oxa1 family membrane protein insertase|nr:membrane protein insertase YidC [Burkholderiaceae bacterium]